MESHYLRLFLALQPREPKNLASMFKFSFMENFAFIFGIKYKRRYERMF